MARRKPYSKVNKTNQVRAAHVVGKGDVVYKGMQCLNAECEEFIFVREDTLTDDYEVVCPKCGCKIESGGETKFYDYTMNVERDGVVVVGEPGIFSIFHDDYLNEAQRYKYCIVCNTMKPLGFFDKHAARASGRQGECRLCKKAYNEIKNGTRLSDQHREAAQKRRLYLDLAGAARINSNEIFERFGNKCFHCGKDLSHVTKNSDRPLDHTLPVYYLWPLTTETATLLCRDCNGNKSGTWPSAFYSDEELRRLSTITGLDYALLKGAPQYNPEALRNLQSAEMVDMLLEKYAPYIEREIIPLRNRILRDTGIDFFSFATSISPIWVNKANERL
jgi:endogenous inhibitor of DNA gyrase (YacG/DUF329 family)